MVTSTALLYNYLVGPSLKDLGKPGICPRPFESSTCLTEPYTELDPSQVAYATSRLKWEVEMLGVMEIKALGVMEIKVLGVRRGSGDTVRLE